VIGRKKNINGKPDELSFSVSISVFLSLSLWHLMGTLGVKLTNEIIMKSIECFIKIIK